MPTSEPILPTTEVARHPPSRLLLQPIALPACSRCVLPTADVVLLARRFKFGRDVGAQIDLWSLCAPHLPFETVPRGKVPQHVYGGHSNWRDVVHAVLYFYSLSDSVQKTELAKATQGRVKWYDTNITLLEDRRPFKDLSTAPLEALEPTNPGQMSLEQLIAKSAERSAERLGMAESKEREGHIMSEIHPRFLEENAGLNPLLLEILDDFLLSESRAPSEVGEGVVVTADAPYFARRATINVERPSYVRNNFGKDSPSTSPHDVASNRVHRFAYGTGSGNQTHGITET